MNGLAFTKHAAMRMAQRSIKLKDADLIVLIGTPVEDGYLVRAKDYQAIETELKKLLQRLRRIVGKRLIIANGEVLTAYHASRKYHTRLLRDAYHSDLSDDVR
jgi:hypothetical protein